MAYPIYEIIDKNEDITYSFDIPCENILYDIYTSKELIKNIDKEVKKQFSEKDASDSRNYNEFYDDFCWEYFPESNFDAYDELNQNISLRNIQFNESAWQNIMIFFDKNANFPAKNLCIVSAEESNNNSMQRVDLLYLRSDGKVLPAEIKISDNGVDAHGQLIRYMAGFDEDSFTIEKIIDIANKKIPDNIDYVKDFINKNKLNTKRILPLETTGILICENFHHDTITAIRYLNEKTNIDIKMFDIDVLVSNNWTTTTDRFIFKAELNEVV